MANLISTLCVGKVEEHLAQTAATFAPATIDGTYAAQGYPELRFSVVRSDDMASDGSPGTLMEVIATVWQDNNGDGS